MEKIQISKEQEKKLLSLFKERVNLGMVFIVIGLTGIIPIIITLLNEAGTYYSSGTILFSFIGLLIIGQCNAAAKGIKKGNYQVYSTDCKKVGWEYATVDNNEILSKKVNKPIKKVAILGSVKAMQVGEQIGILHDGKEFWAFPLSEQLSTEDDNKH
jgi:hypothetical protein